MHAHSHRAALPRMALWLTLTMTAQGLCAAPPAPISGTVVDTAGRAIPQVLVTLARHAGGSGPDAVSVFSDASGRFTLPTATGSDRIAARIAVRSLGYELDQVALPAEPAGADSDRMTLRVVVRAAADQRNQAPASAWLAHAAGSEAGSHAILACVSCHQLPAADVRAYANLIAEVAAPDPEAARKQSWLAIARYMNYMFAAEFARPHPEIPFDPQAAYESGDTTDIAGTLAKLFPGRLDRVSGYGFGAPLAVTAATVIKEYEIPAPNAVREAVLAGNPRRLWIADVSSNRMYVVDPLNGARDLVEVPHRGLVGPHSLHRDPDGTLWIAPLFHSVVANLDVDTRRWRTWPMPSIRGAPVSMHDLSFGADHELLTDAKGRIWYSDIVNNAVGYLDPATGNVETFRAPDIAGRPSAQAQLYGLALSADRRQLWYGQLGIGSFGSFDIETLTFDAPVVIPSPRSGPRRITMGDDGLLYVPLFGSGQLLVYDTHARKQVGLHDLPDRASAPYAVTWDPVRKVVWIPTSNADAIYRFDPRDRSFGVIPLPRTGAFLRMLDVDPDTGVLVTCYGNVVETVKGPRMAVIVDPGDGAYAAAPAHALRDVSSEPFP